MMSSPSPTSNQLPTPKMMASLPSSKVPQLLAPETVLETLLPGYSLFTQILSSYFHIDISSYSLYLLLIVVFLALVMFAVPTFLVRLREFLLYFAAPAEIRHDDVWEKD